VTTTPHASTTAPMTARTAACGAAILLTSTAFAGVIADARWLLPTALAIAVVGAVGVLGRARRWRPALVVVTQCVVLLALEILLFSGKGVWGLIPGSGSLTGLRTVLSHAGEVVRDGVPPVPADTSLQCLMSLSLGGIAIVVDVIALAAGTPAAAGLVLLCVFAVPAALAKTLLPWWSFTLGAIGFAVLLMSGGAHSAAEQLLRDRDRRVRGVLGRQVATVTVVSVVIALLAGVVFIGVGTEGRFPGSQVGSFGSSTDSIGLQPFTSLRGQLLRDRPVELFTVRGLPQSAYLHVMTLRKFDPQRGWELDGLAPGVDSSGALELPPGTTNPSGNRIQVEINPVGFRDPWLPLFGIPLLVQGLGLGWRYDPAAGMVFSQTKQQSNPYTEQLILPAPDPAKLRDVVGPSQVDPAYLDTTGVSAPIKQLAQQITARSATPFDKAVALNEYFLDPANGFSYDLSTAPPTSTDALADFLFNGKRGFCEQFASSMAVLLRAIGIPSRVVVGFTSGYVAGDQRVITTNDAHAWVEAYFPGNGWTTFDPTPLGDGRSQLPSYLQPTNAAQEPTPLAAGPTTAPSGQQPGAALRSANDAGGAAAAPVPHAAAGPNPLWLTVAISVAAVAVLLATPAGLREIRRRKRGHAVAGGATHAASTAWREVLDEFWDRGTRPAPTETARTAATAFADRHQLDEDGNRALLTLVRAVEREWYAPPDTPTDPAVSESLREVVQSLKRTAPLRWRHRLLPRSILRRTR
jgi:transglutaminase-like putative cysteine protease